MRALKIYETLDFKRGMDPKEAMGVGVLKTLIAGWRRVEQLPGILSVDLEKKPDHLYISVRSYLLTQSNKNIYKDIIFESIGKIYFEDSNLVYQDRIKIIIKKEYESLFQKAFREMYSPKANESFNFERGKNPKVSMGIGEINKIRDSLEELRNLWGRASISLKRDESGLYLGIYSSSLLLAFQNVKKYFGTKYFNWNKNYTYIPRVFFCIKKENEDLFIGAYNMLYPEDPFVNESINFERGQDPKSSMGIGNPLAQLANELGMTYAEIKQDKKDLENIVEASLDKLYNNAGYTDKDYSFAFYTVADDPMAYDISRDSRLFTVALWADQHAKDAIRILRTEDRN